MATIHHLIGKHGLAVVRGMANTKTELLAINAAASVMADEDSKLGITHAGFALTNLPHKRIEENTWRRKGFNTTLVIVSGADEAGALIGVPYGSLARLILLYLQTQAIRTGSPEVELGSSMKAWLERMGIGRGGRTYKLVQEQARRISSCTLTFFADSGNFQVMQRGSFVKGSLSMTALQKGNQPSLWKDTVVLDDRFWQSLQEHPVPVRDEAIRAISNRSMAIDIYIWLAYRLHSLDNEMHITWAALHDQFGAGFPAAWRMKATFIDAMNLALAVYPEARVDMTEKGVTLHPSPSAIPKSERGRFKVRETSCSF